MTGRGMEHSGISQVAQFLHGDDVVNNDCDHVLHLISDRQPV